jgi:hypothetical protein
MSEPDPKRRRLLDAGGPVEDDETARQKMRNAAVGDLVDGVYTATGFDPGKGHGQRKNYTMDYSLTPMGYFARFGDLPMMRWLYVNGADTRDVDVAVYFPMFVAAMNEHLDVCKWLFDHGAAKDVKRRTHESSSFYPNGRSPLYVAFGRSTQRDLSRWLILNGALCKDDDSGDLDNEMMKQVLGTNSRYHPIRFQQLLERKLLLEWANDFHRARVSFLLFLSGALSAPQHAYRTRRSSSPVRILSGKSEILEMIGDYVGFVRGREARIIRQLTELLPDLNRVE